MNDKIKHLLVGLVCTIAGGIAGYFVLGPANAGLSAALSALAAGVVGEWSNTESGAFLRPILAKVGFVRANSGWNNADLAATAAPGLLAWLIYAKYLIQHVT